MSPSVSLIVVAAGRGARLGGAIPKQYLPCAGRPLICHTIEALTLAHEFLAATVVIHPDDRDLYDAAIARLPDRRAPVDRAGLRRRDAAAQRPQRPRGAGGLEAGISY